MAQTKLGDRVVNTNGELPIVGSTAPAFVLVANDLKEVSSASLAGKNVVMNIFPSLDTSTCATSVRTFNKRAADLQNTVVLCISKDLPFAHGRFCSTEGIENVVTLSGFRDENFGKAYGILMVDGPLSGLYARSVVAVDESGNVLYSQLVPEITTEPDYDSALKAIE